MHDVHTLSRLGAPFTVAWTVWMFGFQRRRVRQGQRRRRPGMLASPTVRRGCQDVLAALGTARAEIDALNVFPVPDGDTGTNLFLTVEAAVEELLGRPDDADVPADLRALAH